jgi:hypothetical protein
VAATLSAAPLGLAEVVLTVHGGEKVGHWSGGVMLLRAG